MVAGKGAGSRELVRTWGRAGFLGKAAFCLKTYLKLKIRRQSPVSRCFGEGITVRASLAVLRVPLQQLPGDPLAVPSSGHRVIQPDKLLQPVLKILGSTNDAVGPDRTDEI